MAPSPEPGSGAALPAARLVSPSRPSAENPAQQNLKSPQSASRGSTPFPTALLGDLAAKHRLSEGRAVEHGGRHSAAPQQPTEPQQGLQKHVSRAENREESSVDTISDPLSPPMKADANSRRVKPRLRTSPFSSHSPPKQRNSLHLLVLSSIPKQAGIESEAQHPDPQEESQIVDKIAQTIQPRAGLPR